MTPGISDVSPVKGFDVPASHASHTSAPILLEKCPEEITVIVIVDDQSDDNTFIVFCKPKTNLRRKMYYY